MTSTNKNAKFWWNIEPTGILSTNAIDKNIDRKIIIKNYVPYNVTLEGSWHEQIWPWTWKKFYYKIHHKAMVPPCRKWLKISELHHQFINLNMLHTHYQQFQHQA